MLTKGRLFVIALGYFVCSASVTAADERYIGPSELLDSSEDAVVVELTSEGSPGEVVTACIIASSKGSLAVGTDVSFIYPAPTFEAILSIPQPQKGKKYLVFLKTVGDRPVRETAFGYWGIREVTAGQEAFVAQQVALFARWEKLTPEEREELLVASLTSACSAMRRIALDWIIVDEKLLADDHSRINAPDKVVSALINIRGEEDASMRCNAILVLAMTTRKDLIGYLVEALDDAKTRYLAISRLQGHLWKRGDPWPPPSYYPGSDPKLVDQKVAELKKWWTEVGSKDPAYKKFVPPSTKNGTEKGNDRTTNGANTTRGPQPGNNPSRSHGAQGSDPSKEADEPLSVWPWAIVGGLGGLVLLAAVVLMIRRRD